MKSKKFMHGIVGTLALGLALFSGGAAGATAANPPDGANPNRVDTWVVPHTQEAGAYWTAARMQAATSGDVLAADNIAAAAGTRSRPVAAGTAITVPRQVARAGVSPQATQESPVSHIGKVFFTLGGSDYVCSGNAVSSVNRSTVATAGHCVNEGPGSFATRWIFVPAYENGTAPYGQWPASKLTTPSQWSASGDINFDTGFATVALQNGVRLSDAVGASAVSFNQARGLSYNAFGYPAAPPFTGETLQSCSGTATNDPTGQTQSQGIPCDMTGGSSGGPWFIGFGSGGSQNSVTSFGYSTVPNTLFGPYWGSTIQGAYTSAGA